MRKKIACISAVLTAFLAVAPVMAAAPAPVAADDSVAVVKNTPKSITLVATDATDPAETLTYSITSNPSHGTLTAEGGAVYTYAPATDYEGSDSFQFKANDGDLDSNTATVTLTIAAAPPPADNPAADDMDLYVVRNTAKSGTLTGSNPGSGALVFAIATNPARGDISGFNANDGTFTYTPKTDRMGDDSFTFTVSAGGVTSDPATVSVTIGMQIFTGDDLMKYSDLSNWAADTVGQLGSMGMIRGESIQKIRYFHPEAEMTRAEFILFLNAVFEIQPDTSGVSKFGDVTESWLIGPLNAAKDAGIISGSGGNFNPHGALTRAEAAVCVAKALDLIDSSAALTFTDASSVPSWAVQHLKNLSGYQIVTGYDDNTFRPFKTVTRAEGAVILYKAYKEKLIQISNAAEAGTP